jgi:predicted dehydrogenase
MKVILCGRDPVTVDSVAAHIMGFKPEKIKIIVNTHQGGLGEIDLSKIEIVGDDFKSVAKKFRGPELSVTGISKDVTSTFRILVLPSKVKKAPGAKEVGIGVIGAGKIAELLHLPGYAKLGNVKLIAAADLNEERLLEIKKKFGVQEIYTDYHKLLANKKIDAVSICTPPELHRVMTIEALENGKHVLCEKPLATGVDDCYAVEKALDGTKKFVMPAFNYRFTPSVKLANEVLSRGILGDLKEVKVHFKSDQRTWKSVMPFRFKEKTGVITDLGPHTIDTLRFLCGEIEKVQNVNAAAERYGVYDHADLNLSMENGATANIELSWFGSSIIPSFPWEITGKKASIRLDVLRSPFSIKLKRKGEKRESKYAVESRLIDLMNLATSAFRRTHVSYSAEIDYFVQCVANNARPQVTVEDGTRCVEVLQEIARKLG